MTETTTKLNGLTVRELKELLKEIPDDTEITVWNVGNTGCLEGCDIEVIRYDTIPPEVNICVGAESGFH